MEEQPQPSVIQAPVTQSVSNEVPGKKSKATLYVLVGVMVLLAGFVVAILMLNNYSKDTGTPTTTTVSNEIKNTADLDRISQELDNANLDSYDTDLQLNDNDAATF